MYMQTRQVNDIQQLPYRIVEITYINGAKGMTCVYTYMF